ncbi:type II secretion system protein [Lentisphaera profundi]|uniref:Type II secretion system protein n=1 Tax=Lentisphaera profundi TaxID=1658616 RepID=A0ABY7VSY6_9BACT|nr:type II secretion system protein [Lentisphaera profundi]WDE95248.1 type II secretion system protein [Lentisphaera profundi]
MKNKTFTLIEVLVVVAIIGILASLLMPSLKKSRESARIAICLNNLKQHHLAINLYTDDNDQYLPSNFSDPNNAFLKQIAAYLGTSREGYECPGVSEGKFGIDSVGTLTLADGRELTALKTYYENSFRYLDLPGSGGPAHRIAMGLFKSNYHNKITEVDPSTIAMHDYVRNWSATQSTAEGIGGKSDGRGVSMGNHLNKGANSLHIDGSARFVKTNNWMFDSEYKVTNNTTWWRENEGNFGIFQANMEPAGTRFYWNPNY